MANLIKHGDNDELIPLLWDKVKKLLYIKAEDTYRKYKSRCDSAGVELWDLRQICYEVFLKALEGYKPEQENKFTAYLSFPFKNTVYSLLGYRGKDNPINNSTSLDEPLGDEEEISLLDVVKDEHSEDSYNDIIQDDYLDGLHNALEKGMERLKPEQRTTLQCRYYENKTLQETADELGNKSREQARQIESKALREMRKPHIAKELLPFLYDEIESYSLHGSGLQSFRNTLTSSTERAAEHMEELEKYLITFHK